MYATYRNDHIRLKSNPRPQPKIRAIPKHLNPIPSTQQIKRARIQPRPQKRTPVKPCRRIQPINLQILPQIAIQRGVRGARFFDARGLGADGGFGGEFEEGGVEGEEYGDGVFGCVGELGGGGFVGEDVGGCVGEVGEEGCNKVFEGEISGEAGGGLGEGGEGEGGGDEEEGEEMMVDMAVAHFLGER